MWLSQLFLCTVHILETFLTIFVRRKLATNWFCDYARGFSVCNNEMSDCKMCIILISQININFPGFLVLAKNFTTTIAVNLSCKEKTDCNLAYIVKLELMQRQHSERRRRPNVRIERKRSQRQLWRHPTWGRIRSGGVPGDAVVCKRGRWITCVSGVGIHRVMLMLSKRQMSCGVTRCVAGQSRHVTSRSRIVEVLKVKREREKNRTEKQHLATGTSIICAWFMTSIIMLIASTCLGLVRSIKSVKTSPEMLRHSDQWKYFNDNGQNFELLQETTSIYPYHIISQYMYWIKTWWCL